MDPRRKRAVALATLPASMGGMFLAVTPNVHHSRWLPYFAVGVPLLMAVPLAFALREMVQLKRDGNPY